MFVVTPYSRVVALDPATGREKWVFVIRDQIRHRCAEPHIGPENVHRPSPFFGTNHGLLYSISAETGKVTTAFGNKGAVNLRTPEVMSTGTDKLYILPSPPVIYKNLVITGAGTGEGRGERGWARPRRRYARMGHTQRKTNMDVPLGATPRRSRPRHLGWRQLEAALRRQHLGSHDRRSGAGHPLYALWSSKLRSRRNRPPRRQPLRHVHRRRRGRHRKIALYFQAVHHDIWDYDTEAPPTLVDIHRDGKLFPPSSLSIRPGSCSYSIE